MSTLLERYERMRQQCNYFGGFHPDSSLPCYQALSISKVMPAIAIDLAMLLDDMAIALKAAEQTPPGSRDSEVVMFGLTKREQCWKAEQEAAETLVELMAVIIKGVVEIETARAKAKQDQTKSDHQQLRGADE